jgi:hypothetical protein
LISQIQIPQCPLLRLRIKTIKHMRIKIDKVLKLLRNVRKLNVKANQELDFLNHRNKYTAYTYKINMQVPIKEIIRKRKLLNKY